MKQQVGASAVPTRLTNLLWAQGDSPVAVAAKARWQHRCGARSSCPCSPGSPGFTLYYDTSGIVPATPTSFGCATGGGGAVKSWNPVALGVAGSAVVTGLDILYGTGGFVSVIDDIRVGSETCSCTATSTMPASSASWIGSTTYGAMSPV